MIGGFHNTQAHGSSLFASWNGRDSKNKRNIQRRTSCVSFCRSACVHALRNSNHSNTSYSVGGPFSDHLPAKPASHKEICRIRNEQSGERTTITPQLSMRRTFPQSSNVPCFQLMCCQDSRLQYQNLNDSFWITRNDQNVFGIRIIVLNHVEGAYNFQNVWLSVAAHKEY